MLKKVKEISVTNTGNAEHEETITSETTFLRSLFSTTKPRAEVIKEGDKRFFSWTLSIAPQQTEVLSIMLNFRPLFAVLALLAIVIGLYYYLRSPVLIKKSYADVSMKHGGVSNFSIVLNLKNRGNKALSDIKIIDKVPSMLEVEKKFKVGSIHPTKIIDHGKKGTVVRWEIDSLEPGEERIINYSINSKLSILGMFKIPAAIVRYKTEDGKKARTRSNALGISPG